MTDADRIKHARLYLDKLAHGISPLDDTPVPAGELLHNVHVSRCLSYVADVLDTVCENGTDILYRMQKQPFMITQEQIESFEYSTTPITVSDLARRLNDAADVAEGETQLRYSSITYWLIETGLMTVIKEPNEMKLPTESGRRLGIGTEERFGHGGAYTVVVFNEAAQRHIVANIDAIVASEDHRFQMQGQPWRPEDDATISRLCANGVQVYEIALELRRSVASVRSRCKRLGIDLPLSNNSHSNRNSRRDWNR